VAHVEKKLASHSGVPAVHHGYLAEHLIVTPVLVFVFCVLIYRDVSSMPMVAQAPHAASHMVTHVGIPAR